MFNHVAPYRYRLSNLYLSVADIEIQTYLRVVVGPGIVSTSPAFMRSIASHPEGSTQFALGLPDRCDSSTACRLCRLEPN